MSAQYKYEFRRRWNARLPRNDIKFVVERMPAYTDDETVAGEILERLQRSKIPQNMWDACKRYALLVHRRQKDLYYAVLRGSIR